MYYRIIVKKNNEFLFRTSKITTGVGAAYIYACISAGFRDMGAEVQEYQLEVLQVDGFNADKVCVVTPTPPRGPHAFAFLPAYENPEG